MENGPRHASCFMSREVRGSGIWWPKEGFLFQWNTTWGSLDSGITRAEALVTYDPSLHWVREKDAARRVLVAL